MKNDVGYLIKRINDKLAVRADAELKQYHLTMSQGRVFLYLSSRGGQATQKEIETFLGVAHPTVVGIVVAEWNEDITGALLDGAVKTLEKHGALPENIHVKTVPGSFELIYGAHQMVLHGGYDAVIILGSVIRGETPHFDYICQGVTAGIARLNTTSEIPIIYGLLTTNDKQQALDRCGGKYGNKGDECAIDAIKMAKF